MATWYAQNGTQDIRAAWNGHPTMWNSAPNGSGTWLTWANLAANDVLCANGKMGIGINVGFTCGALSTRAEGGGMSGGQFLVYGPTNFTINANFRAGPSNCLCIYVGVDGHTLTLNGDAAGGDEEDEEEGIAGKGIYASYGGTAKVILNGNVYGGDYFSSSGIHNVETGETVIVTGNIINNLICNAVLGPITYDPGPTNFVQYPKTGGTQNFYYGHTLAAPVITAITESAGIVTLTITGAGLISIYSRIAGSAAWTLSKSGQSAGAVQVAGLAAGATWEFYAVRVADGMYSAVSNLVYIYVHDSSLPTVSEIELAAAGVLNLLGVFKTAARWKHQLSATEGGLTNLDKHAPCAFVGEQPSMNVEREGGYTLDRKITLVVLLAQKDMTGGGEARAGDASTVGTQELRTLIIAALDKWHPGAGFDCDDFYYKGAEEIIDMPKQHGVKLVFEAKWMKT